MNLLRSPNVLYNPFREATPIQVKDGGLFILPIHDNPRKGWEEAFAAEAKAGHKPEEDPFNGIENEFDREEWKW